MEIKIVLDEEAVLKEAENKVRRVLASYLNTYPIEIDIQRCIKKYWEDTVETLVVEELKNSDALREQVREAIKRKLRAQLTKLMKEPEKGA